MTQILGYVLLGVLGLIAVPIILTFFVRWFYEYKSITDSPDDMFVWGVMVFLYLSATALFLIAL